MSELHRQGILTGFAVVRRIDGENVFLPSGQLCRVVHPGAVDFHGMDAAQGTDQPFLVELTVMVKICSARAIEDIDSPSFSNKQCVG